MAEVTSPPVNEKQVEKIMTHLRCTREEALDVIKWDAVIDSGGRTPYDMSKEEEKEAVKIAAVGQKTKPNYQWTKRERKANPTKGGIIQYLFECLADYDNVVITNKERQITFSAGGNNYELTLVQKRPPKK